MAVRRQATTRRAGMAIFAGLLPTTLAGSMERESRQVPEQSRPRASELWCTAGTAVVHRPFDACSHRSCRNRDQGCRALVLEGGISDNYTYYCLLASRVALQASGRGTTFLELSAIALGAHPLPIPPI